MRLAFRASCWLAVATLGMGSGGPAFGQAPNPHQAVRPLPVESSSKASSQYAPYPQGAPSGAGGPGSAEDLAPVPEGRSGLLPGMDGFATPAPTLGATAPGLGAAPPGAAPSPFSDAFASAGGGDTGLGDVAGGAGNAPFPVMGDASPLRFRTLATVPGTRFPTLPRPLPPGPGPVTPPEDAAGRALTLASVRGIKISENQSPIPQDRIFAVFSQYENLFADYLRRDQSGFTNLRAYLQFYGFEKTFLDGDASIGIRVPINTLVADSPIPRLGGTSTSFGSLTVFSKYILAETTWSNGDRFFLTTGMSASAPTGPRSFAGFPGLVGFRSTYLQPFVGYLLTRGRFYFQGFSSIEVPVGSGYADVTSIYNDLSIGYYLLRRDQGFLTAFAPTFETHVGTPLNHRGYSLDPAATPDVVNLTMGGNFEFARRAVLQVGYATPVTGPQPFDGELLVQFNIFFGGPRRTMVPPVLGGF